MSPELVEVGLSMSAVALIIGAAFLLVSGSARSLGEAFRQSIEPTLTEFRSRSTRSRSELADMTILAAIGLALLAVFDGAVLIGSAVAVLLYVARPSIRRATSQEHRLLAVSSAFSLDLMIGTYLPFALAHVLLFDWIMALCLFAVVLALSWPAGGGETIPGRRWQPAPVPV